MEASLGILISPVFMTCDQVLLMVSGGLSFCSVFLFSLHIQGFQPPSHLLASEPSALYLDLLSNFHIWIEFAYPLLLWYLGWSRGPWACKASTPPLSCITRPFSIFKKLLLVVYCDIHGAVVQVCHSVCVDVTEQHYGVILFSQLYIGSGDRNQVVRLIWEALSYFPAPPFLLKLLYNYLFVVGAYVPQHECRGLRTTFKNQFTSSIWAPELGLR